MARVYNFSPGPATLPTAVLEQAKAELLDWQGLGMSVMEISHRSSHFEALAAKTEQDLRELLAIPTHYRVLFLAGGATIQFATLPMNLLGQKSCADYFYTGIWSAKAIQEAQKTCQVNIVTSAEANGFTAIPDSSCWQLHLDAAYVHYTDNETIGGLEFAAIPEVGAVPLVVDMSSSILSKPVDVSRFGLIYASAQKNIGPAGLSIVIIREDLLDRALPHTPMILNYTTQAKMGSLANTPPTYAWYLTGLVFEWLKAQGGLDAIASINQRKAAKLYQAIDNSKLYVNKVQAAYRSKMNVPFFLRREALTPLFIQAAQAQGLANLKGHKLVGGIRASIYNAMPEAGVDKLIAFMQSFEQTHG